ncbi:MAG TPA: response regulator [Anaerolineales bacterium]|nr:response regulator [Anaerolineales bacterium]
MAAQSLVLIIDDNEDFQNLYGMVAEQAGYVVEHIYNGKEAVERLEREPIPFAVLLDSRLPGMSGGEILRAARRKEKWSRVLIYIMTADLRGAQEFREYAPSEPHADAVIEKGGATISELRELFRTLGEKKSPAE